MERNGTRGHVSQQACSCIKGGVAKKKGTAVISWLALVKRGTLQTQSSGDCADSRTSCKFLRLEHPQSVSAVQVKRVRYGHFIGYSQDGGRRSLALAP